MNLPAGFEVLANCPSVTVMLATEEYGILLFEMRVTDPVAGSHWADWSRADPENVEHQWATARQ